MLKKKQSAWPFGGKTLKSSGQVFILASMVKIVHEGVKIVREVVKIVRDKIP